MEAVKLFVLKTINLATLVYQLFVIQTNANTAQKYLHTSNYADYLTVSTLYLEFYYSGITPSFVLTCSAMHQSATVCEPD